MPPQKLPSAGTEWINKTIRLTTTSQQQYLMSAKCFGALAVHVGHPRDPVTKPNEYIVTHVPTGLWVIRNVKTEDDAELIAEILWETCRRAFQQKHARLVMSFLPSWVKAWIYACRKVGAYTEIPQTAEDDR